MTELKPEVLQEDMKKFEADHKKEMARLGQLEKRRQRLDEAIHRTKRQIQSIEGDHDRRRQLLIISGIPETLVEQRLTITTKRVLVRRTDITVAEQGSLRSDITKLTKELQDVCPHSLILTYQGFPSYSSYDEPTPGLRVCALCNMHEDQRFNDEYKVLSSGGRVVKSGAEPRDWHFHVDHSMLDMPYAELRESFIQAVG